jgi:hypothetical protein
MIIAIESHSGATDTSEYVGAKTRGVLTKCMRALVAPVCPLVFYMVEANYKGGNIARWLVAVLISSDQFAFATTTR